MAIASTSSSSSSSGVLVAAAASVSLVVATAGAWWIVQKQKNKRKDKLDTADIFPGIPSAPGAHWLFGHLIQLNGGGDFVEGYQAVFEKYADPATGLCSCWFVHQPSLTVLLGRDAKAVLTASSYRESIKLLDLHNEQFLGLKALTALMGKEWRMYRSAVHKSFTPGALQLSQRAINQVGTTLSNTLLKALSNGNDNDKKQQPVLPLMKMATMDVFGLVAMDVEFQCCQQLELTPVASAFEHLTNEYTRRMTTPWNPASWLYNIPTKANRYHRAQRGLIRKFIADQIAATRIRIAHEEQATTTDKSTANKKQDLLTNILHTANAKETSQNGGDPTEEANLSDEAITDILMTLLFGG